MHELRAIIQLANLPWHAKLIQHRPNRLDAEIFNDCRRIGNDVARTHLVLRASARNDYDERHYNGANDGGDLSHDPSLSP